MAKYVKLKGYETPAPEDLKRAQRFMNWYGMRFDRLRREWLYAGKFDDEVATDTALYIYDCIALKGLQIKGKYKWYFLRAYHMRFIAEQKKKGARQFVYLDDPDVSLDIAAPTFDYEQFENMIDQFTGEMLDFVRENYAPLDASLFEIYIALQPDMSYKRMGKMLGYPVHKIWPVIGAIKRDLSTRFIDKRSFLLSLV